MFSLFGFVKREFTNIYKLDIIEQKFAKISTSKAQ